MSTTSYSKLLYNVGATLIGAMGTAHLIYTFYDCLAIKPKYFAPVNDKNIEMMKNEQVQLAENHKSNLWKAWLGFNISHSYGAMIFSFYSLYLYNKTELFNNKKHKSILYGINIFVSLSYTITSYLYWYKSPSIGLTAVTSCFAASYLLSYTE